MKLFVLILLATASAYVQKGGINDSVNDVSDTIRTLFATILGVIYLIGNVVGFKKFEVHKNIRKRAMIVGLRISFFFYIYYP